MSCRVHTVDGKYWTLAQAQDTVAAHIAAAIEEGTLFHPMRFDRLGSDRHPLWIVPAQITVIGPA